MIGAASGIPGGLALSQNRPNPFSPNTEIRYQLPSPTRARLAIYDVAGRLVATLVDRDMPAGNHAAVWDGRDDSRLAVASGIYFYRLETAEDVRIKRMHLVR